jgi:hypothetical protein
MARNFFTGLLRTSAARGDTVREVALQTSTLFCTAKTQYENAMPERSDAIFSVQVFEIRAVNHERKDHRLSRNGQEKLCNRLRCECCAKAQSNRKVFVNSASFFGAAASIGTNTGAFHNSTVMSLGCFLKSS